MFVWFCSAYASARSFGSCGKGSQGSYVKQNSKRNPKQNQQEYLSNMNQQKNLNSNLCQLENRNNNLDQEENQSNNLKDKLEYQEDKTVLDNREQ